MQGNEQRNNRDPVDRRGTSGVSNEARPAPRKRVQAVLVKVSALDESHLGRRIWFPRPAGAVSSRPQVSGVLRRIGTAMLASGRQGVEIYVSHGGGGNSTSYGPLRGDFEVKIGGKWVPPKPVEYERFPHFPFHVKTVRVRFLGGPLDGTEEDVPAGDFSEYSSNFYRDDPDEPEITHQYMHASDIKQIEGGLWWGQWRLMVSTDSRKPYPDNITRYNWGTVPPMGEWKPLH